MTAATENQAARCVACGDFYQYRDGLCWHCIKACERLSSEMHNTRAESTTDAHKDKTP